MKQINKYQNQSIATVWKMKILTKVCLKEFNVVNHSLLISQMN